MGTGVAGFDQEGKSTTPHPQRQSPEPAWHRRQRRDRQQARAIIAIEAARRRLELHHGRGRRGVGFGGCRELRVRSLMGVNLGDAREKRRSLQEMQDVEIGFSI